MNAPPPTITEVARSLQRKHPKTPGAVFPPTRAGAGARPGRGLPLAGGRIGGDCLVPYTGVRFGGTASGFHVPVVYLWLAAPQVGGAHLMPACARYSAHLGDPPPMVLWLVLGVALGAPPPVFPGAVKWAPPGLNRSLEEGVVVLPYLAVHVALGSRP